MSLQEILRAKGDEVFTTVPSVTLSRVSELLVEHNCGSLVVVETEGSKKMVGIITERDILRACAAGKPLDQVKVDAVMSKRLITGRMGDSVAKIMGLLTENRVRHLPVIEGDELVGMISIGDVVKAQHDQLSAENHYLKNYIRS